ncbi:MAG TPA: YceH family protein [Casimicrobiaceae bacterium]|nr:YceH family protein [Casimicrobiaceae bacterium]
MSEPLPHLSLIETRVLGVLVEKQHTVPDTYPLTLNALVAGCTQKTSRDPILDVGTADVQAAIDHLRQLSLVVETSGGRVMRYAHNIGRVLGVPTEVVALLATLMLRGPQTSGEIRQSAERLHRFADISSVEAYLDELSRRAAGALVIELTRSPGTRETRWMHLLSGPPAQQPVNYATTSGDAPKSSDLVTLRQDVDALQREVADLRASLGRVMNELGLSR